MYSANSGIKIRNQPPKGSCEIPKTDGKMNFNMRCKPKYSLEKFSMFSTS